MNLWESPGANRQKHVKNSWFPVRKMINMSFFHIYETLTGVQLLNNYGSNFQGENYGSFFWE
jgi:hypothetical protein